MEVVGPEADFRVYEAVNFDQPWTNTLKLIRSSYTPLASKTATTNQVAGYVIIGIDDPTVKLMADSATTTFPSTQMPDLSSWSKLSMSKRAGGFWPKLQIDYKSHGRSRQQDTISIVNS